MSEQKENNYIIFKLANYKFCMSLLSIREINKLLPILKVPQSKENVTGLMNLRGKIVTVLDFCKILHLDYKIENGYETRCVVFKPDVTHNEEVGFLVDEIVDVIEFTEDRIEKMPSNMNNMKVDFLKGVLQEKDEFLLVLDYKEIFKE